MRVSNDLGDWIKMFLVAVIATAEKGKQTFQGLLEVRNDAETRIMGLGRRAKTGHLLLRLLYRQPFVNTGILTKELKISQVAADQFVEVGILHEITGQRRNRLFQFRKYFRLFQNEKATF